MNIDELEKLGPGNWYFDVRDQLRRHIYDRTERAIADGDAARDAVKSIEELDDRRNTMRSKFIESIGGLPSCDTPLNPQIVGVVECDGYRIEKIIFESRPETYVTANLYVPDGIVSPSGAVLFLCGHAEQAKHDPEYQIVCRYLVKSGLVVLAQDPIGQGERMSYFDPKLGDTTVRWGVIEHDHAGCQCWPFGDGIARYFVHDAIRGIDYLCTRPEVDSNRIGVTGNSGGGTQTSLVMMCDPRIAAAAPGTFIMDRRSFMYTGIAQDSEQIWPRWTAQGYDHEDILMMMSPRPVRVLAVSYDFFPIEGTRRTVDRCRRFWEMYGKADCLDLIEDKCIHKYTRNLAKSAAEFFSQHLNGRRVIPVDSEIDAIDSRELWCTKSGQVRGDIKDTRAVYEENQDHLSQIIGERESIGEDERKNRALEWLNDRVFDNRKPCDLNPRHYQTACIQELSVEACFWWSQEGIFNHAFLFRECSSTGTDLPVTIAVWDGGTSCLGPHIDWIRSTCTGNRAVMVLDVTGVGSLQPNSLNSMDSLQFYGANFKFSHDLMWLDDSLAAMRVYDVIRSLDMAEIWPGLKCDDIRLYAHGRQGIYAQLASVLDQRILGIEVHHGVKSFADWIKMRHYDQTDIMSIVMPGILKYLDIPEIAGY